MDFFVLNMANLLHCSSIGFGKDLIKTGLISSFMKPLSRPKIGLGCFNLFQKESMIKETANPVPVMKTGIPCSHSREPVFKRGGSLLAPCSTLYRIAVQYLFSCNNS